MNIMTDNDKEVIGMDWMKLKSGSDVRGTAVGDNAVLTPRVATRLGMAFARFVEEKKGKPVSQVTIALGRDSRISGPAILRGAAAGLAAGVALMTGLMLLWNYFITPLYMGYPREAVAAMLLPVFLPFNLIKSALNAALTMLIYKPVSRALKRSGLV